MAYKFQLGAFTASGSIKAEDGFDAADQNITNVGDIALDSLSADGLSISISDDSLVATNKKIQFRDADLYIQSDADGQLKMRADSDLVMTIGSDDILGLDSSGAAITGEVVGSSHFSGSGDGRFIALDINSTADVISSALVASFASMKVDDGSTVGCDSDTDVLTLNSQAATFANDVDVNIAKAGGLQIAGTAVTSTAAELNALDGIADAAYDQTADSVVFFDATDSKLKYEAANDFVDAINGNGLDASSGTLVVSAAQTGITSIYNTSLKLGRAADDDNIDFGTDDQIKFNIDNGEKFTIGSGSIVAAVNMTAEGNLVVEGNLTVQGTTVTVDSTTILVTGSISFEGSTGDDFETTLGVIDPTADRAVNIANSAGTLVPFAAAPAAGVQISSTPAELNLLDGSAKSTSSITIDDADGIIIIDGNTTKQIPASDLKTYIGNNSNLDVAIKDDTETLAVGVNYFADLAGAEAVNLPASPSVGDAVYVKAPSNCSSVNTLTVNRQGSHTIDAATSIVLESPHAAVMLVYVVANTWKVF